MMTKYIKYQLPLLGLLASVGLSQAAIVATGVSSTNNADAAILTIDNADLGAASTVTGADGALSGHVAARLNDGLAVVSNVGLWLPKTWGAGTKLPETYTFALDVASNALGYDISSIESFAGWSANGPQLANQKYNLSYSTVGDPATFISLGQFEYIPFDNNTATGAGSSRMTVADDGGAPLATGVHSVRLEFLDHGFSGPDTTVDGTAYYEIDINAVATVPELRSAALLGIGGLTIILRCEE